jgi:hypothetical protein
VTRDLVRHRPPFASLTFGPETASSV